MCVYKIKIICKLCGNTCVLCCVETCIHCVEIYVYCICVYIKYKYKIQYVYHVCKHMYILWKHMSIVWKYEYIVYLCIQNTKYGYLCGSIQYIYIVCVYIHEQTHTRTPQQRVWVLAIAVCRSNNSFAERFLRVCVCVYVGQIITLRKGFCVCFCVRVQVCAYVYVGQITTSRKGFCVCVCVCVYVYVG